MGLFALPGIFLSIPGGWLADRYGVKIVGLMSLSLMIAGTLVVASGSSFWALATGRLIAGIGAMTLAVAAASLISTTFSGPKLGIAMGFYNTGMPLGTILSFVGLGGGRGKFRLARRAAHFSHGQPYHRGATDRLSRAARSPPAREP